MKVTFISIFIQLATTAWMWEVTDGRTAFVVLTSFAFGCFVGFWSLFSGLFSVQV